MLSTATEEFAIINTDYLNSLFTDISYRPFVSTEVYSLRHMACSTVLRAGDTHATGTSL